MCVSVSVSVASWARPKSVTQTVPCSSSRRFDGLMSRWIDALGVGVGQRLGDLDADPGRLAVVEPGRRATGCGVLLQHDVEPAPGDVLHDVVSAAPRARRRRRPARCWCGAAARRPWPRGGTGPGRRARAGTSGATWRLSEPWYAS